RSRKTRSRCSCCARTMRGTTRCSIRRAAAERTASTRFSEEEAMPLSGPSLDRPIRIPELLARGLQQKPDEVALVSAESRWTWRELDRASSNYAANLLALGLKPGDRVASLMPNRDALPVHYLGCFKSGMVATPLNYRYMPPEIDHALEVSEAAILIAHAERD